MDWLADPLSDPILRRAALEVVLLGVTGGLLGCWIVFYELAYGAESLAHALFPGLVAAALLGLPLLLGGATGILAAALAVAVAGRVPGVGRDTAVAVVVTTMLGAGALLALSQDTPPGLGDLLFGDVLGVSDGDLALAGGLALAVIAALRLLHGRLLAVGFDRTAARALGVSPGVVDAALAVLLAAAILVAVQGLGNLLVVSILVGPAATARHVADRMPAMMAAAVATAIVAGLGGLLVSYHADTAAGASIALATVALWALARLARALRARRAARPALPSRTA
ncbi:MAG: metal ABC transporter permease [Solirubrobacteraceae bacterium]|nr:metal ABC transporter permease [Solirubrobacteraceae bacterium]